VEGTREQLEMFENGEYSSYEALMDSYASQFAELIAPKGETTFGFWMQTLADAAFLDLELRGLTERYTIDPVDRSVQFEGDEACLRNRVAHLEKVKGVPTLYSDWVDAFDDTNAYAFHNLYPYKGKFYPRIVRTLINAFQLQGDALILDPFNGSGTTTHEASLMGIQSVGIDITPIGTMIATLKNELLFAPVSQLQLTRADLLEILHAIRAGKWEHPNFILHKLMLLLYFDTADAFERTSRYSRKGEEGLFIEKFRYIATCLEKTIEVRERHQLVFKPAQIFQGDALKLDEHSEFAGKFDACITSPPYYFSIDYVGKDRIAYEYLGIEMPTIESNYLGMKGDNSGVASMNGLPRKVVMYYEDLRKSIQLIYWALRSGGKLAIIVGDSTVNGKKIPTTLKTKEFCEEAGFIYDGIIFNPLLGARNRAIRGESVILYSKPS